MANWISSKLKVAETFLQQIDQQAAESLRKGEKPRSDDLDLEISPRTTDSKPLKDQLKKKTPETSDLIGKLQSDQYLNGNNRSSNDQTVDNLSLNKEVRTLPSLSPKLGGNTVSDADWTELLSAPSRKEASGVTRVNNGVAGARGVKKEIRRLGSGGSRPNLPSSNAKRSQKAQNNSLKAPGQFSDVQLQSSGDLTQGLHNEEDAAARNSNEDERKVSEQKNTISDENNQISRIEGLHSTGPREPLPGDYFEGKGHAEMTGLAKSDRHSDLRMGINKNQKTKGKLDGIRDLKSSLATTRGSLKSSESSDSETDSTSSSGSESEHEREERRKRRQQILAEKAAVKAVEAIRERENMVARLEGEKQSLEKILEERAKQQAQEASELQMNMIQMMDAVELEKQKHNNTRMEALSRLAKLETTNADLAKSLATAQWNLELKVNQVAELRQHVELKEASHEDLQRKISSSQQKGDPYKAPKGIKIEKEILEEEYSFLTDKVQNMQEKARILETSIESTEREIKNPTEVELALRQRLGLLTDHLIQKQAQVEALSSQKATLMFKIEAVSRWIDESKSLADSAGIPSTTSRGDLESGAWDLSGSKLRPLLKEKIRSGQQHLGSFIQQLDSIFCAGARYLRRNSTARIWACIYIVCLHLWVLYIFTSHSRVAEDGRSGAVVSLENINNTGGV